MPQERLSSLGDTTTLGPEWLQRGIRTSPKSGEPRERDGLPPPAATHRYGRDQLLLLQSSMELPSPPRMANGRPKPAGELNALQQKFPVFGAMTKEHLVSEGVLPASTLEDKQVAGTLRGRGEGRGRSAKGGRGKGRGEEEDDGSPKKELQASPVQTTPGGSAVGSMAPLELPRQVSEEKTSAPRNPMSSFLDRVLKKGPAPEKAEATMGLPPGAGLPPPAVDQPAEAHSPTARPPVPEKPPPPPPGPGEAEPIAQELPVRPGPLPSSPPRHPPAIGVPPTLEPIPPPEPIPSPQRASVNLASALAGAASAPHSALEREFGLGLGEGLMPPTQPQALQPGRVTVPQRQAPRLEDPSVNARLQEDMEEFEKGSCWYYKDPSQKIQGPFTTQQMRSWHQVGYFKSELPIRFRDGNFYRLDHVYPEAPFAQLPATVDPRAAAQQAAAQAQAQAQQQAQQQAVQAQAFQAMARQRALLADPTIASAIGSSGYDYMRLQQAQAQAAAHVNAQAQIATMKSLMGMPPFGGYDDRRWPEELKAMGMGAPTAAAAVAARAAAAAANAQQLELERQRLAAAKEQQRMEQQRLERERLEEQRIRQQLVQAHQQAQQAAQQAAPLEPPHPMVPPVPAPTMSPMEAAPAKPPPPMVPPVPAPTMSPMEAASKEERKKPAQPKKSSKNDNSGPTQVAPGPVPKEAPPLVASPTEFPALGGSSEDHVIMAPADSSTGFWERPPRPVKVGVNDPPIPPKADPKAKAAQKQQQKAKDEEKSEARRAQVKELLTEHGITLEEPMVNFVLSVNSSSEVSDYLEALKVTEAENARRFAEAYLAKGLAEAKVEKSKEAPPKRKHRVKGKEVDPSMLGFTAVPRGHYES